MDSITFSKMHGLGNDFAVVDATAEPFVLDAVSIGRLGNRKTGIGFDQLLIVEAATSPTVDFNYRIFNTDGSEVEHCGNGARCFAKFVIDKGLTDKKRLRVQVKKGVITIDYRHDDDIEVAMGAPILAPAAVPFAVDGRQLCDDDAYQNQYDLHFGEQSLPVSVLSMGNPHAVFFVSDLWSLEIAELGAAIQQSAYFPQSVNVNFVEVLDAQTLALRTYERGVGETDACGTGACASAYAAAAIGAVEVKATNEATASSPNAAPALTTPPLTVKVRGGALTIRIDNGHIFMSGPARLVYDGVIR